MKRNPLIRMREMYDSLSNSEKLSQNIFWRTRPW